MNTTQTLRLAVLLTLFYSASAKHILQFNAPTPEAQDTPIPTNSSTTGPQTTLRFLVVLDNYTAASEVTALEIYDGYRFWEHTVNNVSRGIKVGGKTLKVELIVRVNPTSKNSTTYGDTLKAAVAQEKPNFILGGDTSYASQDSKIARETERIAMLCCHGPPVVYKENANSSANRLFGIHVSSELYTDKLIRNIVVNKKAKKIAFVVTRNEATPTEPLFTVTTCQAAVDKLKEFETSNRYTPVPKYGEIDLIQGRNTSEYFDELAQKIKDDPEYDIIVGCTLNFDGRMLLEALSRNSVPAKAVFITVAPTNQGTVKELTSANVSMNYIISAGQWHPELNFEDSNRTAVWSTATDFALKFENYTADISSTRKAATYTHASAAAAAYAIQLAIEAAFKNCSGVGEDVDVRLLLDDKADAFCQDELDQTGYERILDELRILNKQTFFGTIKFDPSTQRNVGRDSITLQLLTEGAKTRSSKIFESINFGYDAVNLNESGNQTLRTLVQEVVLPSEYGTSDMILPRPPREGEPDRCLDGEGLNAMNDCEVCEPGKARAAFTPGIFSCVECNYTSYMPQEGGKECLPCPEGTSAPTVGSNSLEDCVCMPGYYNIDAMPGKPCEICPEGANCTGGTTTLVPQYGFWVDNTTMGIFSCSPASSCINKPNQTCAEGWGGPICSLCGWDNALPENKDYFYVFGSCIDCKSKAVNFFAFAAVMLAWLIINLVMAEQLESLALLIDWMQLMSLVGSINAGWPASLQKFFSIAQFFAFEVDVVSLRCLNPSWNFFWDMVVQFSIPIITVAIMISWLYAIKFLKDCFPPDEDSPTEGAAAGMPDEGDKLNSEFLSESKLSSRKRSIKALSFPSVAAIKMKAKNWVQRGVQKAGEEAEEHSNLIDEVLQRVFNILEITYLASTQYGMSALRGITVAGQKVVARAPYTPQTPLIVAVGAVGLAVFGIVFPMVVILMMWSWSPECPFRNSPKLPDDREQLYADLQHKRVSDSEEGSASSDSKCSKDMRKICHEEDPGGFLNEHNKTRLGWLYEKFRVEVYYMAAMHLAHRFVFAATVSLLVNPAVQLLFSFITTALFAAWFLSTRPYFSGRLNIIQAVMYASIMVQIGIGVCFYGKSFSERWYNVFLIISFVLIALVAATVMWIVIVDWLEARCADKAEDKLKERFNKLVQDNEEKRKKEGKPVDDTWRERKHEEWKAVKKLIDTFTPSRLLSWLNADEKLDAPPHIELHDAVVAEKDGVEQQKPSPRQSKQHSLNLFFQVAHGTGTYLLKHTEYSHLSMRDEAELWRALVLEYPEIVSYLFHEKHADAESLYKFFEAFYNRHWHQQQTLGQKLWEKFHNNVFVEKVSKWAGKNFPQREKRNGGNSSASQEIAFFDEIKPLVHNSGRLQMPGVTWLLDRRERASIAQWMSVTRERESERVAFAELVRDMYGLDKKSWEEKALFFISFGMLSYFKEKVGLHVRMITRPQRRGSSTKEEDATVYSAVQSIQDLLRNSKVASADPK